MNPDDDIREDVYEEAFDEYDIEDGDFDDMCDEVDDRESEPYWY